MMIAPDIGSRFAGGDPRLPFALDEIARPRC
jgi:hypothetical protein